VESTKPRDERSDSRGFFGVGEMPMPVETPTKSLRRYYEKAAQEYLRKLPLEHFMESIPQATQRKITLESLDLVAAKRPDVQVFNELLVQYPRPRRKRPGQVVPDNMVVIHAEATQAVGSYDTPFEPVGLFWVLEYVSKNNRRKDYKDNLRHYERALKVPYYLLFEPDKQLMTLYHHTGERYRPVAPDKNGRCAIAELEIEVAMLDGWVRFWYRGELLPLPADLQHALEETQRQLAEMTLRLEAAERKLAELQARGKNGKN
jgi:Putative restriction endonuclease